MTVDNPHDRFFKETFSHIEVVVDFLQAYLPESISNELDLTSLKRDSDSFTDETLNEHFADLAFSAMFDGNAIKVTLLLEHKSYTESHIHFQLNQYLLNVWQSQLKQKQPLTPILPVIVYHGMRHWRKRMLTTYFTKVSQGLLRYLPEFDYVLIDLSKIEERFPQLKTDYARLTALLLQFSRRKSSLLRIIDDHARVIQQLVDSTKGQAFIQAVVIYLNWSSGLTTPEIISTFRSISIKTGDVAMSAAEKLINEGLEIGLEKGLEKAIKGMLKLGMSAETIATALEMSKADVERLIKQLQTNSQ